MQSHRHAAVDRDDDAVEVQACDDDAAYALQLAEVKAASKRQASEELENRRKVWKQEESELRVAMLLSKQQMEQEDFNVALNLGRPPGPWLDANKALRSKCGLPGCVASPQTAHQGFCSTDHLNRARARGLLAPPSDEIERCFVGPRGDFTCLLLTKKSQKRADIVQQFLEKWRKPGNRPRVEHVYDVVPPPHVRERFDRYATCVGNIRRRFHGTSSTCTFGTSLSASPCAEISCSLCNILASGFSLAKAGTGPNRALLNLRYGPGIYFSATSGKSNDYANGSERNRSFGGPSTTRAFRVMIVASVAAGKAFITQEGALKMDSIPDGYHSVVGEPGKALNYDELVVYAEDAAVPESLIVYSL